MELKKKSVEQIKEELLEKLSTTFGCGIEEATDEQVYQALAMMVRDEVMQRRSVSRGVRKQTGSKKVYYLSAEFLVGRARGSFGSGRRGGQSRLHRSDRPAGRAGGNAGRNRPGKRRGRGAGRAAALRPRLGDALADRLSQRADITRFFPRRHLSSEKGGLRVFSFGNL